MSVHLYPLREGENVLGRFYEAVDEWEADSWCLWLMGDLQPMRVTSIDRPILVHRERVITVEETHEPDILVVKAKDLKGELFQLPTWHPDRVCRGKAIEATIEAMSDDALILARLL